MKVWKMNFNIFYSCPVTQRNFLDWINHWFYSGDLSYDGYIELSLTLELVAPLYHFSRQQLNYLVILNLHQFSLCSVLNLLSLIDIQTLFYNLRYHFYLIYSSLEAKKVTSLFFMSNFSDPVAINENSLTLWLSIFTKKWFLWCNIRRITLLTPRPPWSCGRNIANFIVDLYSFSKSLTAETRCFSIDSIRISHTFVL